MAVLLFIGYSFYKNLQLNKAKKAAETSQEEKAADRHQSKGLMRVECRYCGGTGRAQDPINKTRICFVCKGAGSRQIRNLIPGETICPYCGGMGKILAQNYNGQPFAYDRCSSCNGKGILRNK